MGLVINALKMKEEKVKFLKEKVSKYIQATNLKPSLTIINASNDSSSKLYIKNKIKLCKEIGIAVELLEYPETISTEELEKIINILNKDDSITAIILQLPLYKHLDKDKLIKLIDPSKDCDGFSIEWLGKLVQGEDSIIPCTPLGVMSILNYHKVDLIGKEITVVGKSAHVGMPLSILLSQAGATVTIAHSKTNLEAAIRRSDIVISCVGKYNLIRPEWIKENATIIGVGYDVTPEGKLCTDYMIEDMVNYSKAKLIGDRINTTGLATVLSLCENVIKLFELQNM